MICCRLVRRFMAPLPWPSPLQPYPFAGALAQTRRTMATGLAATANNCYSSEPRCIWSDFMEQRTPDQLVEWAYDQFLEQAADMLAPEQIVDITLEFEQRGAVEATLPNADWSAELGVPVDMERWVEVWVGLLDHQEEFEVIFATFLLPRHLNEHDVHVRWHRQQQA
ncbi:TPA: DUF440 family protein [Aeromonas hydrophila]|nr:DUF440 family protein [Aeromonas hydrophila]HAU4887191.1 DUF440 family protein [Aeromonas hydrophila]